MKLYRGGSYAQLQTGPARDEVWKLLDPWLSYFVEGAQYSDKFKTGEWDGRKRLHRKMTAALQFPAGLADEVAAFLEKKGIPVELEDRRTVWQPYQPGPKLAWTGPPLRAHQEEAVEAALASDGGVLRMPVRSGKTLTAAYIASRLGLRTLFVAPSNLLVDQALGAFRAALSGASVTAVGGGQGDDDSGDIVIASMAALCARFQTKWFAQLSRAFSLVFVDEAHHSSNQVAEEWREVAIRLDAWRKFALTGTLPTDKVTRLWSKGIYGPVLIDLEMSRLVAAGHLVPARISFVRHAAPMLADQEWSRSTYREGIVDCAPRNTRLLAEAARLAKEGHRVLIDAAQVGHARNLAAQARGFLPGKTALMVGATSQTERRRILADLATGRCGIVVGNLLGEGVDVPELSVVVNAEGGRDSPSATQRLRNLTPCPGKTLALVIEAADHHHKTLQQWTLERLRMYRREAAFTVEVEEAPGRGLAGSQTPVPLGAARVG